MSHFAKVKNGEVKRVIAAEKKFFNKFNDSSPGKWLQCSYNTRGGVHYDPNTGKPSDDQSKALRKNYPGKGWLYDHKADAFYPPKPFESWTLNQETFLWDAPVPHPNDGKHYVWDEAEKNWIELTP